jgi:CheY-like chemotaxis protein
MGRVLVVEDDADIREVLVELIQSEAPDLEVSAADNGYAALEKVLGGLEPCLILLDMMMPVMDGFEFLDALDDIGGERDPAVLIISAHLSASRGLKHPRVKGLLVKPFDSAAVLQAVKQHCHCGAPA